MRRLAWGLWVLLAGCEGLLASSEWQPGMPVVQQPPRGDGPVVEPEEDVCAADAVDVGRVTLRRLNRFEYDSTVRDLLGDTTHPAQDFPADDFGHGYDNQGDVLSTAPLLVEKYDAAATRLVKTALASEYTPAFSQRQVGTALTGSVGSATGSAWNLFSNGTLQGDFVVPTAGTYTVTVRAWEQAAGPDRAQMQVLVNGAAQGAVFQVAATQASPQSYTRQVTLTAGTHRIGASFLNDYYQAPADRNLVIEWVEVTRPGSGTPGQARVLVCDPVSGGDACVRTILQAFARKAWRRPVTDAELTRLTGLVKLAQAEGDAVSVGLELALSAVLLSPHFLFRVELDLSTQPRALDDHELATRLSYFLWGSMPDDTLRQKAEQGVLRADLAVEVQRMLADPRADAIATQFAGSWLWSRAVPDTSPDPTLFPTVNAALKADLQGQTTAFFRTFFREPRPMSELLTANDTFLTDALARHYGLPLPGSTTLTRVQQVPELRRGLLGQGGVLTVTSQPNRTSPVKRGKWVLAQLLCIEPPPPPANVEAFEPEGTPTGTLREQFEAHRAKPECAGCHAMMDPIGFGLETFDAVGRARTTDSGGFPIDSSGTLYNGGTFNGPVELAQHLSKDPLFNECVARQLFTWGLGRAPVKTDRCTVKRMTDSLATDGTLAGLITTLVQSDTFSSRHGEAP